ncbi:hypothetical protein LTR04_004117, partial [Oleoguttula sp. CCFEE 6159]
LGQRRPRSCHLRLRRRTWRYRRPWPRPSALHVPHPLGQSLKRRRSSGRVRLAAREPCTASLLLVVRRRCASRRRSSSRAPLRPDHRRRHPDAAPSHRARFRCDPQRHHHHRHRLRPRSRPPRLALSAARAPARDQSARALGRGGGCETV